MSPVTVYCQSSADRSERASRKLSSRERAKNYRRKHKAYTERLVATVPILRRQAQRLSLATQLLRSLVASSVSPGPRRRIMDQVCHFIAHPLIAVPGFEVQRLEMLDLGGFGDAAGFVVHINARTLGKYTTASVESAYWHFPGDAQLLDKLLHCSFEFPCLLRFFFTHCGRCVAQTVELEWTRGLLDRVKSLAKVASIAGPLSRLGTPYVITDSRFSSDDKN